MSKDTLFLKERIKAARLRITPGRLAVLRVLSTAQSPMSHSELVLALRSAPYDRVTIFRNLNHLTDAGLVEKKDLGDRTWRFELKRDPVSTKSRTHNVEHPHFTRTDCGEVQCLPDASIGIRRGAGVPKSVSTRKVRVTLQVVCDDCH